MKVMFISVSLRCQNKTTFCEYIKRLFNTKYVFPIFLQLFCFVRLNLAMLDRISRVGLFNVHTSLDKMLS